MNRIQSLQQTFGEEVIRLDEPYVKKMSRDYYWYSPVLKKQLSGYAGDCVAIPRNEDELEELLSFAARHRIPVVPKGGGTGNYGQIVPLQGGIILDTTKLNEVKNIEKGFGTFGAGITLGKLENLLAETNQELRFYPSTYMKSTLAGFIAGGTGGIGSIEYGTLWDEGNVLGLTVMTLEEKPKRLTVHGKEELARYIHNYGLSGVIVDATIALAPKTSWQSMIAEFERWEDALFFSEYVAKGKHIQKRLVSVSAAPLSASFQPLRSLLSGDQHIVLLQIAPQDVDYVQQIGQSYQGKWAVDFNTFLASQRLRATDFSWNHVTLWRMKDYPDDTYVQARFDPEKFRLQMNELSAAFPDDIFMHVEWIKAGGQVVPSSQPVICYKADEQLFAIMEKCRQIGIRISNPHTYILEEGGKDDWIEHICAAKRVNDPYNLLNPGKTKRVEVTDRV
ncbi:FAD-binding oxidoreductase [Domibacillus robiginosus]|uniref:FAD-binding oxidoreductase n=1 Tax=Domibacillus robiginosus TaxID=1071054 RepID=UPI00067BAF0D|nr:FAD-binding oxidoreductase [Domibacillus robiginosus]